MTYMMYKYFLPFVRLPLYFEAFIYLFVRESEHKQTERQAEAEGEADSPLSKEPDAGLDPWTLGS